MIQVIVHLSEKIYINKIKMKRTRIIKFIHKILIDWQQIAFKLKILKNGKASKTRLKIFPLSTWTVILYS